RIGFRTIIAGCGRALFIGAGSRSAAGRRIARARGLLAPGGTTGVSAGAAVAYSRRRQCAPGCARGAGPPAPCGCWRYDACGG
ncbi:hypothetical protein, partial [Paenibacillus odorifer]|uniref:hypothetical protein n=1 Tax=Paenibacillus odorifer TaxID=189426 RepID=UPI003F856E6A